jgi:hypothetical protein
MVRLYLFAEGRTEQTFANTVLKPYLAAWSVYLHKPVLVAHARKKGKTHRGGGRKYTPLRNDILRFMRQEKEANVYFTTMIDLYGIHGDFPGLTETKPLLHVPYERVQVLERAWQNDIADVRFIPFIQMHEFEALLFAGPEKFGSFFDNAEKGIAELKNIAKQKTYPELIDDGQATAPSKRIASAFPDYAKAKPVIGPQVGEAIGLDVMRRSCPHFDSWMKTLETLDNRRGGGDRAQSVAESSPDVLEID